MFETSSTKYPKTKEIAREIPFLMRINFLELLKQDITVSSEKVTCERCGAFLSNLNDIREQEGIGLVYQCVFCGTINQLKSRPENVSNAIEISLSDHETEDSELGVTDLSEIQPSGKPWIAVIDTSGSMQNEPIAAVKRSLCTTLDSLKNAECTPLFGLIEFNYGVNVINLHGGHSVSFPRSLGQDIDGLRNIALEKVSKEFAIDLNSGLNECKSIINSLVANGGTALGPAMVVSQVLAERWNAERVILLTDGQANIGVGSLEGPMAGGVSIYRQLAEAFRKTGTSVDIVGVLSNQFLHLRTLGIMSRMTRGNMFYVNPLEIDMALKEASTVQSIATDLRIRVLNSGQCKIADATGVDVTDSHSLIETGQADLTNVSIQDEVYISLEGEDEVNPDVSVQLQISYLDLEGQRKNRIFSMNIPITENESEFIDSLDPRIPATYAVQKSAMERIKRGNAQTSSENDILREMETVLVGAGRNARNGQLFDAAARKLRQITNAVRSRMQRFEAHAMCYCMPPLRGQVAEDYSFVESLKLAKISRDELFSNA